MNQMPSKATLVKVNPRELPTAKYVTITPSQAQLWLDQGGRNRKVSQTAVDKYAAIMTRGDWLVTNQGIAFNERGELMDGQHRLLAIVQSQVSVTMLVVSNESAISQLVLDQGYRRTPYDQIALQEGYKVFPIHTAVAKAMLTGIGGAGFKERDKASKDIQLLRRFYLKHIKAIEFVVEAVWTKHGSLQGVLIAPVFAPIARATYHVETELLRRFGDLLAVGMSADGVGGKDTAAIVLRNWLMTTARERRLSSRSGVDRNIIYKKTEVALRAFIKGESIQRIGQMTTDVELFVLPEERGPKKVVAS